MDDGIDLMFKNQVNVVKIFTPPNMDYMAYLMEKNLMTKFILFTKYQLLAYMEKNKKPTAEQLKDIDVLVYDIQDVGLRFYTFIYTLAYSLIAASENYKKFIVLDRINPPLGRVVFGPRIKKRIFHICR